MSEVTNSNLENHKKIVFRKIPSLQFLYEISEDGRIFRNVKSKKQLCQKKNNQGYWMVFGSIKGARFTKTVHSLVAECWLGEKPDGLEIDHIDRDKDNNDYRNLRYVTHSKNNLNRIMTWKNPVVIRREKDSSEKYFETSKACAIYLSEMLNKSFGSIRARLSSRRKYILGYNIEYLPRQMEM